jgi:hypothetical protein
MGTIDIGLSILPTGKQTASLKERENCLYNLPYPIEIAKL